MMFMHQSERHCCCSCCATSPRIPSQEKRRKSPSQYLIQKQLRPCLSRVGEDVFGGVYFY